MSDQRHPYAGHPAAAVLADHLLTLRYLAPSPLTPSPAVPAHCDCGWRGAACDHPAHLAETLDRAGLLLPADVTVVDWP